MENTDFIGNTNFTPQQSLGVIRQMVAVTRERYECGGGSIFLIWGYTSFFVSALVLLLGFLTDISFTFWLWWLIPVIGCPATYFYVRTRDRGVRTYIDRFISGIWITIGGVALLTPLAGIFLRIDILFVECLVLSLGVVLTGLVLRFSPLVIGGVLSILLTFAMPIFLSTWPIIGLFMLMFVVSMIIPGHILNYRGRCLKN